MGEDFRGLSIQIGLHIIEDESQDIKLHYTQKERLSFMRINVLLSVLVLFSLLASCNLQAGQAPGTQPPDVERISSDIDIVGTAVELTSAARLTEIAGSVTPTSAASPTFTPTSTLTVTPPAASLPTQCNPLVTTNVVANVRSGPNTAYDIVGSLALGQTAIVAGRNDANTWWYIDYPAGSGSHAWIAGSVTTASCLPSAVQVVAAPPFPTSAPQNDTSSDDEGDDGSSGTPDLVAYAMQYYVVSGKKVHVMVTVKNTGDGTAGPFIVNWMANQDLGGCHWTMTKLAAGKAKNLECDYTYEWGANKYTSTLFVDSGGNVAESDEGNNKDYFDVKLNQ
ncbi:MAG: hypothetical protein EHM40_06000 [Chloroflexi bacterium]|nr:MAG: hypothetical protein EHM40_06000 [Chloroflexota bacterium]